MPTLFRTSVFSLLLLSASSVFARPQQQVPADFAVVHVIGLEGIKHNAKGKITVSKDTLEFTAGPTKRDLTIASIQDVLTGADSQRLVGGTLGTLSMFAPYGSGRFLSLFRTKLDTLTISYRDSNGALHGAIFTLAQGQAAPLKREMVADGAKTSVSVETEGNQQAKAKVKA